MERLCRFELCGRKFAGPDDYCSRNCQQTHEAVVEIRSTLKPKPKIRDSHNVRNYRLQYKYGLTEDDYDALLAAQGGKCCICHRKPEPGKKKLSVDHCHNTGLVRGLLCANCNNKLLPVLENNPTAVDRAIEYLRHPPAVSILGRECIVPDRQRERDADYPNGRSQLAS